VERLRRALLALLTAALASCAGSPGAPAGGDTVTVAILAFNDFHGNLEPPRLAIPAASRTGTPVAVPAGGAAYLASAIRELARRHPHHAIVSAGDLVGASPLASALFLDEPTIAVADRIGLDFNAVGNHEFDRGAAELLRLQHGGCERHAQRDPCAFDGAFRGARFGFLAANVLRPDGSPLLPAFGLKRFATAAGPVTVGFIGMTLRETPTIVAPDGVRGLAFADEAATANALVPVLKARGADAIVVLLHQGGATTGGDDDKSCPGLTGEIVPIVQRLDPAIDAVVSGHTHRAYVCEVAARDPGRPLLLTSAGQYGTLVTSIELTFDARTRRITRKAADNVIVQGEGFTAADGRRIEPSADHPRFDADAGVRELVDRAVRAAAPIAQRPAGRLAASMTRMPARSGESVLGDLIADAQLAATRGPERGGAQVALMNSGGVRADLIVSAGGGPVTYGQLFSAQPFGNTLVVKTLTGAQLQAVLEQQVPGRRMLFPSAGLSYRFDPRQQRGRRVSELRLGAEPVDPQRSYRVTVNSFLAAGGDGYAVLAQAPSVLGGPLDVDALEQYVGRGEPVEPPAPTRIVLVD
jgi:5'-nucleotidase